jgi:hypothetical protein
MADVFESCIPGYFAVFWPCDDGDDEAFREGVAISIGDVVGILPSDEYCGGVVGSIDDTEDGDVEWTTSSRFNNKSGSAAALEAAVVGLEITLENQSIFRFGLGKRSEQPPLSVQQRCRDPADG